MAFFFVVADAEHVPAPQFACPAACAGFAAGPFAGGVVVLAGASAAAAPFPLASGIAFEAACVSGVFAAPEHDACPAIGAPACPSGLPPQLPSA
jgi:hypothetical protein